MNRGSPAFQTIPFTPVVKWLIVANIGFWIVFQFIFEGLRILPVQDYLALTPGAFLFHFQLWQIFTYMFLHSLQGVTHIVFNMLMLWMFGAELELRWGRRFFLSYYLVCGAGAGLIYAIVMAVYAQLTGSLVGMNIPVLGASGAIFGLMMAHGLLFSERIVYFFMLFPLKTKYFVLILGFIQFASLMTSSISGGGVSYLAHLGGLVVGFVFLWLNTRLTGFRNDRKKRLKGKSNLRLVVDNEAIGGQKGKNPKYWN